MLSIFSYVYWLFLYLSWKNVIKSLLIFKLCCLHIIEFFLYSRCTSLIRYMISKIFLIVRNQFFWFIHFLFRSIEIWKNRYLNLKPNDSLLYREKKYLCIFLEHLWHSRAVEKSRALNGLLLPDKRFGTSGKSASKVWRGVSCQEICDWNRSSLIINIYLWNTTLYWD